MSERARAGSRGGRGQRRAAGLCWESGGGGGGAGGAGDRGASAGAAAGRRQEPAASAAAPAARAPARSGSAMELPAVGEHVFAVESIEKKRIRKVGRRGGGGEAARERRPEQPARRRGGVGRLRAGAGDPAEADGVLSLPPSGQSGVSGEMERLVPQVSSGGGAGAPGAEARGSRAPDRRAGGVVGGADGRRGGGGVEGGGGGEVGGRHWGSRAAEPEPGALCCAPLSGKCHH